MAGDLDTIVLRAMDLGPGRRYASAEQLAADVQRYLDGLPVLARKDTAGYRLGKFVRRHKAGVAAAAALLLLILGFSVTVTLLFRKAERDRDRAEAVSGFLVDLFERADPSQSRGKTITARGDPGPWPAADRGGPSSRAGDAGCPDGDDGEVYRSLGLYDQAQSLLEESLHIRRRTLGPDHLDVAESELNLALVFQGLERPDESEALTRKALETYRRHGKR